MLQSRSFTIASVIVVPFITLAVHYLLHVEYFKVFPFVFVPVLSILVLCKRIPPARKLVDVGIIVLFGAAMFALAASLWK